MLEIQKNKEALGGLVNSLRDKEGQIFRIINSTEDIIFTYNETLEVTQFNRAFEKMLGQINRRAKLSYHASHLSHALNHDIKEYLVSVFKGKEFATQIEVNQLHFLLNVFPISKELKLITEGGCLSK
jgi:PAS domain-containing protein